MTLYGKSSISDKSADKVKKIFYLTWPFIVLAVLLIFTWEYVKQFLPENEDKPALPNPEVFYNMREGQDDLSPMSIAGRQAREELFFTAEELAEDFSPDKTVSNADELAAAMKTAVSGSVIALKAGKYQLNLNIEKDITLVGAEKETILTAADAGQPVIKSVDAKLKLVNLTIKDAQIGFLAEGGEIEMRRVKFDNLAATACYGANIKLNFSESYIYNSLSALKLVNSSGLIADSIIRDNAKSGAELRQSVFDVTGNVITGNKSYGVYADGYSQAKFKNNFISGNAGWNIRVEGERKIYK